MVARRDASNGVAGMSLAHLHHGRLFYVHCLSDRFSCALGVFGPGGWFSALQPVRVMVSRRAASNGTAGGRLSRLRVGRLSYLPSLSPAIFECRPW
jgi:hypothetical protein